MATAEELLMATAEPTAESTEEILVADLNTRVISIPATLKILGVESDDDVKRLKFRIPRHYGEFDLSTFKIQINFENERGNGDVYPVKDLTVDGDAITFTWLVDRVAFNYPGDVKFSICMKLFDSTGMVIKELNTTYTTLPVLEGLETEKAVVEQNPSAFDQIMYRLYAVEAATGNGRNGYYSVVKVSKVDNGVLFTIVNQTGETVAYVKHGENGYTPVKGVDYWTAEDIVEVEQHAKAYVDSWAPIYKTISLSVDGWADDKQTVTIPGVNTNSIVFISPDPTSNSYRYFAHYGVKCVAQNTSSLTFQCKTIPKYVININVAIYNGSDNVSGNLTVTDDGEGNVIIT